MADCTAIEVSQAKVFSETKQLLSFQQIIKDLQQLESVKKHTTDSLDTSIDNIVNGLDSLSYFVKELREIKSILKYIV